MNSVANVELHPLPPVVTRNPYWSPAAAPEALAFTDVTVVDVFGTVVEPSTDDFVIS